MASLTQQNLSMRFDDPRAAQQNNAIEMALKMVGSELNPTSKNEQECLQHTIARTAQGIKRDVIFNDQVIKAQVAKQPIKTVAKELSESIAYYLDVFLNESGFHSGFSDFYARGIRKQAYKYSPIRKTLTQLEFPLRLLGSHHNPVNYFDVAKIIEGTDNPPEASADEKATKRKKEKGKKLKNKQEKEKKVNLNANDLCEVLDGLGVFSVIIEVKSRFFVAVKDSSGVFIMLDCMKQNNNGQPLSSCTDKVQRAFGFFKAPTDKFKLAGL